MELTDFERELSKASSMLGVTIPPQLETYLKAVADVGTPQFPWNKIKSLFKVKLEQVIFEFNSRQVTVLVLFFLFKPIFVLFSF